MSNYAIKENDRIIQIIYNPDNDILINIKKSLLSGQTLEKTDIKEIINEEATLQELAQTELLELEQWFDDYDIQVKQYERAIRLGKTFDKSIEMLDNEASEKADRIKELRKLLEG